MLALLLLSLTEDVVNIILLIPHFCNQNKVEFVVENCKLEETSAVVEDEAFGMEHSSE